MTESLLAVYPNEMLARLWADILHQEGIGSVIKPQSVGYGGLGHVSFIPHSLYVLSTDIEAAREIIENVDGADDSPTIS